MSQASASDSLQSRHAYAVERVSACGISVEDFTARYVSRCVPVILTGAMESWAAYGTWTTEFFKRSFGDTEVSVDWGTDGPGRWRKMQLGEYLDSFSSYRGMDGPPPYLRTWNILDDLPELRGSYEAPAHFVDGFHGLSPDSRPPFEWIFIGPQGARTVLHEDIWGTDAWLAQLQGRKHFMLYHPGHRCHIETDGAFVDPGTPDLEKFPTFPQATPVEAVLEPGEVIYIPRRWPHYVVGLDDTVSVTVNFLSRANHKSVFGHLAKYIRRRKACERILGRSLRVRDNLMKYCCHGGQMPADMAKRMLEMASALDEDEDSEDSESNGNDENLAETTTDKSNQAARQHLEPLAFGGQ